MKKTIAVIIIVGALVAGCAPPIPEPTATATPPQVAVERTATAPPTPTSTPVPSPTPTVSPAQEGCVRATAEIPEGQNPTRYVTSGPASGCYDSVGDFLDDIGLSWGEFVPGTLIAFWTQWPEDSEGMLIPPTPSPIPTPTSAPTPAVLRNVPVPEEGAYTGAYLGDFTSPGEIQSFENVTNKRLAIIHHYLAWAERRSNFSDRDFFSYDAAGKVSMISWKPVLWDGHDVPIPLQDIIDGEYDSYIRDFAEDVRDYHHPIFIRLGWEMNGGWMPYSGAQNGDGQDQNGNGIPDGPERYVQVWRRIVETFDDVGAHNVSWVWSPDPRGYPLDRWNHFSNYYPSDDYVDWMGLTIANFGYAHTGWTSFDEIAEPTMSRMLEAYPHEPLMIAELACAEQGGDKAQWILDSFERIVSIPRIHAVVLFSKQQERDWRIDSSTRSLEAYVSAVAAPYFTQEITY